MGLQLLHGQPVLPADGSKLVGIVLVRRSKTFEKSNALGRFLNAQAVFRLGLCVVADLLLGFAGELEICLQRQALAPQLRL